MARKPPRTPFDPQGPFSALRAFRFENKTYTCGDRFKPSRKVNIRKLRQMWDHGQISMASDPNLKEACCSVNGDWRKMRKIDIIDYVERLTGQRVKSAEAGVRLLESKGW